jgi:hypothetical protein
MVALQRCYHYGRHSDTIAYLAEKGFDPLIWCQTSGTRVHKDVLNEAVQRNSGRHYLSQQSVILLNSFDGELVNPI